jgi:hypothetical protein
MSYAPGAPEPTLDDCKRWASAAEFFRELEQLHALGRPDDFVLCSGPIGANGLCRAHQPPAELSDGEADALTRVFQGPW